MPTLLIDICHPAHVHFFRAPIQILSDAGHTVHVTSRHKDVSSALLDSQGLTHYSLGKAASGTLGLAKELLLRDIALWRLARQLNVEAVAAIGGTFAVHAAALLRIPSVVFYDTEIARLQNFITYPLATRIIVPRAYRGRLPKGKSERYPGFHELSYLHPKRFTPCKKRAHAAGLAENRPTFLVRLVSWTSNHDIGEIGLSEATIDWISERLERHGKVILSSEATLPHKFRRLQFAGRPEDMHHLMAFCAGYFGESATMAAECAVLGVPAVYSANAGRGYIDELESRYGLAYNARPLNSETLEAGMEWLFTRNPRQLSAARERMLSECSDVADLVAEKIIEIAHSKRTH